MALSVVVIIERLAMNAYEKFANIFMLSMAGQMSGLTREQFIQTCKSKFPVEADFVKMTAALEAQVAQQMAQMQASLKPGHVLAFGYPIGTPDRGTLH